MGADGRSEISGRNFTAVACSQAAPDSQVKIGTESANGAIAEGRLNDAGVIAARIERGIADGRERAAFLAGRVVRVVVGDAIVDEDNIGIGRECGGEPAVMGMAIGPFGVTCAIFCRRQDAITETGVCVLSDFGGGIGDSGGGRAAIARVRGPCMNFGSQQRVAGSIGQISQSNAGIWKRDSITTGACGGVVDQPCSEVETIAGGEKKDAVGSGITGAIGLGVRGAGVDGDSEVADDGKQSPGFGEVNLLIEGDLFEVGQDATVNGP